MANPYQYMDPIGSALVGIPEAYRAEMGKKRELEQQQIADAEAAKKRDMAEQQRQALSSTIGAGGMTPEMMQKYSQELAKSGSPEALQVGIQAQQMGLQERQRKMEELDNSAMRLGFALHKNATPAELSMALADFDKIIGAKTEIKTDVDPETGYRTFNFRQVDKDGKEHITTMNEDQIEAMATGRKKLVDIMKEQGRQAEKTAAGARADRGLDIKSAQLDETKRKNMVTESINKAKLNATSSEKAALDDPMLHQFVADRLAAGEKVTMPSSRTAKAYLGVAKLMNDAGNPNLASRQAELKSDAASLMKLTTQTDFLKSFDKTARQNGEAMMKLADKVPDFKLKWFNKPVREIMAATGDPDITKFKTYLQSLRTEYMSLQKSNPTGASHVGTEQKFNTLLDDNAPISAIIAALDTFKNEGHIRIKNYEDQQKEIMKRIESRKLSPYGGSKPQSPTPSGYNKGQGKASSDPNDFF